MKKILVLSGKGGTGKTTLASSLIKLSNAKSYADCDVDAPNLHLVTKQKVKPTTSDFYGLDKAMINVEKCIQCGECVQGCKFNAIHTDKVYTIDQFSCEGCGVCERLCSHDAITFVPSIIGEVQCYQDEETFATATLTMGSGSSGKLVNEVKKQLKNIKNDTEFCIIDGPPGIGCPVLASINGVDQVILVVEASKSGLSDMKRLITTCRKNRVDALVCINKYDVNEDYSEIIRQYCIDENIPLLGRIPYDQKVIQAVNEGKCIVEYECDVSDAIKEIYHKLQLILFTEKSEGV